MTNNHPYKMVTFTHASHALDSRDTCFKQYIHIISRCCQAPSQFTKRNLYPHQSVKEYDLVLYRCAQPPYKNQIWGAAMFEHHYDGLIVGFTPKLPH